MTGEREVPQHEHRPGGPSRPRVAINPRVPAGADTLTRRAWPVEAGIAASSRGTRASNWPCDEQSGGGQVPARTPASAECEIASRAVLSSFHGALKGYEVHPPMQSLAGTHRRRSV